MVGKSLRPEKARDQIKGRGLSRSIRPDQSRDGAFLNFKRESIDRLEAVKLLREIFYLKDSHLHLT